MSRDPRLTRRAVLLGALAVPVAACHGKAAVRPRTTPPAGADTSALQAALDAEHALLADYGAAVASGADSAPFETLRATHAAHAHALAAALGLTAPPPSTSGTSIEPTATARMLRQREASTGNALTAAAIAATDGRNAALLASIAAAHLAQSHLRFAQTTGPR